MLTDNLTMNSNYSLKDKYHEIDSIAEETEPVLKINTNLLKHPEIKKYKNRLIEDIQYEKVGSNGIFESNPKLVKIKGFELNKKLRVKILLTNKSKFSQRVSILPPTTPFFKIKYSRRGAIPQGLSETIILSFIPQSYCYYYDFIRIICEGDKMIIPIHAFPRMNIHQIHYVPSNVDFGTVTLNNTIVKNLLLKNIIDVGFEYELIPVSTCEEIKVDPLYGDIEAINDKNITITFSPKSYGIFKAEYKFLLSEFDYQPVLITVFGSCNAFDKVINENIIKHMKKLKGEKERRDDTKLLNLNFNSANSKGTMQSATKLSAIEPNIVNDPVTSFAHEVEKQNEQNKSNVENDSICLRKNDLEQSLISNSSPRGISKKFKNFPSNKEREFLNYFNTIDSLIKDKEIKYIRFIGKPLLNNDETMKILNERLKENESNLMIMRKLDLNRHQFELDTEKCQINRKNRYIIKPTFDLNQKDKFFKARHYFQIFLQSMTNVVINTRAEKRLKKIRDMINKHNIKSPIDFADFVDRDWLNFAANNPDNNENKEKNTTLNFIAPPSLHRSEVYLAYDFNLNLLKQGISHENNINLVEYKEFQNVEKSEAEIIGYKEFKSPGITLYETSTDEKILRSCADNENVIRGERGDSEISLDKIMGLIEMPIAYKSNCEVNAESLLFNNPMLKKYAQFNPYSENSITYNLQPVKSKQSTDIFNSFNSNYANDLYSRLPLSFLDNIPINEMDNYTLIGDASMDFVKKKIDSADERELFVKTNEQIDEDNLLFNMNKEDDEKLRETIEKDDEVVRNLREINKDEIFDSIRKEKINLEQYLQAQKRKWMSTLPTILENLNSTINNPNNKFII